MSADGDSAAAHGAGGSVRAAAAVLEGAKRGRVEEGRAKRSDDSVKHSELDELLGQFKSDLSPSCQRFLRYRCTHPQAGRIVSEAIPASKG